MTRVCVLVKATSPTAFKFFGHRTFLRAALDRLADVRGVDRVVVLVGQAEAAQVPPAENREVLAVSGKLAAASLHGTVPLAAALPQAAGFPVVALLNPLAAAIKPCRVEECLELVRARKADLAHTALRVSSLEVLAQNIAFQARDVPVAGVIAFRPDKLDVGQKTWARKHRAVLVNRTESLEADDHEDATLIDAMA